MVLFGLVVLFELVVLFGLLFDPIGLVCLKILGLFRGDLVVFKTLFRVCKFVLCRFRFAALVNPLAQISQ